MNKSLLIENLNSNQELLQCLAHSKFLKDNVIGMLRNIESIIPEDCRENFYTNLKTLRIDINNQEMLEKCQGGAYFRKENKISIDRKIVDMAEEDALNDKSLYKKEFLMSMYHELLHMASTTRNEYDEVGGFQNIVKKDTGEFLYADILDGMTEGFTEYLTLLAFNKENFETTSIYGRQINSMNHLSMIVGFEKMKRAYFNNRNGMQDVEKVLQEIDGNKSHDDLFLDIERDYKYNPEDELFDSTTLTRLGKKLLMLSKQKLELMKKNNSDLSEEFVSYYWKEVSKVINTKEKLELMRCDSSKYSGIEELENIFKNFSSNSIDKEKSKIETKEKKEDMIEEIID